MVKNKKITGIAGSLLTAALVILCLWALGGLFGCSQDSQPATQSAADTQVSTDTATQDADQGAAPIFGNNTSTALKVTAVNATGRTILAISIKVSTDTDFPASLMPSNARFTASQKAILCFEPAAEDTTNASSTASSSADTGAAPSVALKTLYSIQLTFIDGATVTLHDMDLAGIDSLQLCLSDDDVGYITYTDASGTSQSTLESEKALLEDTSTAAQGAASTTDQSTGVAADQSTASTSDQNAASTASDQYQYDYSTSSGTGGSTSTDSSSSSGSSGSSQSEDSCVDDLILN